MSSGISFGGLNSGLDTDRIISQLLQIERQPIQRYEQRISETESTQEAFRSLNSTVGELESPSNTLTDTETFQQKEASSSDSDFVGASIVDSAEASTGTTDIFVDQLATSASVESGEFINNQKLVAESTTGTDGEAATSVSDFEVMQGSDTLNLSEDYLDDLSKSVQTSEGQGNGDADEFTITVDPNGDTYSVGVDLDDYSDFESMINDVNDQLADDSNGQRLEFRYNNSRDRFEFVPTDGSETNPGGTTFQLQDNVTNIGDSSKGFLQQVGIAEDDTAHTFSVQQSEMDTDGDGEAEGRNIIGTDGDTALNENNYATQLTADSGTIEINNTQIDYDSDTGDDTNPSTINELVDEINQQVDGINASFNSLTDKVQLETQDTGQGEIEVSDVSGSGNLADVLNLREGGNEGTGQVAQNETLGKDAEFEINGTGVTSSSNTVTRDGVEYSLNEVYKRTNHTNDPVEISVEDDTDSITSDVEDFVNKFNKTIGFINETSQMNPATEPGGENNSGPLANDSLTRGIKNTLTRMVSSRYNQATEGNEIQSLADVGIELKDPLSASDSDQGKLNFNKSKFKEALEQNPQQVRDLFTAKAGDTSKGGAQDGVAVQVNNYIEGTTGSNGVIADRIDGFDSRIGRLNERIEDQERRVQDKRDRLEAKYRRMEESLRQLQEQQGFLGG